jgi:nitrous oxidase accessory protein NosD
MWFNCQVTVGLLLALLNEVCVEENVVVKDAHLDSRVLGGSLFFFEAEANSFSGKDVLWNYTGLYEDERM